MTRHIEEVCSPKFIYTREYKRFVEFCDACKKSRYIGLCHGEPGVGKTLSAAHYTGWDIFDMPTRLNLSKVHAPPPDAIIHCRALFYTVPVVNSPVSLYRDIHRLREALDYVRKRAIESLKRRGAILKPSVLKEGYNILVVDEADRLSTVGFELMRSIYDDEKVAVILIGMPGIEKRLARYQQLYSRVGFLHHFQPLDTSDLETVITTHGANVGLTLTPESKYYEKVVASIIAITGGNFRLMDRLFEQMVRIVAINKLKDVTTEVVDTARSCLVFGG